MDFDISDVILEDGVGAIAESFMTSDDSLLTGNVLAANQPFSVTTVEIDQQSSLGNTNLLVEAFRIGWTTSAAAGEGATLVLGTTLTV